MNIDLGEQVIKIHETLRVHDIFVFVPSWSMTISNTTENMYNPPTHVIYYSAIVAIFIHALIQKESKLFF